MCRRQRLTGTDRRVPRSGRVCALVVKQAAMKVPCKATQYSVQCFDDDFVPAPFDIPVIKEGRAPARAAQSPA
jgi:hypothetical protein